MNMIAWCEWCELRAEMAGAMCCNDKFSERARRRYERWSSFWYFVGHVCRSGLLDAILYKAYVAYQVRQERKHEARMARAAAA